MYVPPHAAQQCPPTSSTIASKTTAHPTHGTLQHAPPRPTSRTITHGSKCSASCSTAVPENRRTSQHTALRRSELPRLAAPASTAGTDHTTAAAPFTPTQHPSHSTSPACSSSSPALKQMHTDGRLQKAASIKWWRKTDFPARLLMTPEVSNFASRKPVPHHETGGSGGFRIRVTKACTTSRNGRHRTNFRRKLPKFASPPHALAIAYGTNPPSCPTAETARSHGGNIYLG